MKQEPLPLEFTTTAQVYTNCDGFRLVRLVITEPTPNGFIATAPNWLIGEGQALASSPHEHYQESIDEVLTSVLYSCGGGFPLG